MGSYAPIYHMLYEQTVTVPWRPVKCKCPKGNKETGYPPPPSTEMCVCVCVCGGLMWRGGCLLEFEHAFSSVICRDDTR